MSTLFGIFMSITPEAVRAMKEGFTAQIDDETLRDGLQSSGIRHPTPEEGLVLFDLMYQLGTQRADIGFAAAGEAHMKRIKAIAEHNSILDPKMEISCAARMTPQDIEPIVQISQEIGAHFWADAFIGITPERIDSEGWNQKQMIEWVENTVGFSLENDVDVMLVTESTIDGIEKNAEFLEQIYLTGLNKGAKRVCISDTTGARLPHEVEEAVLWMRQLLNRSGFEKVAIDFHGHNDLRSAVPNSIAALRAGAQRVHATILHAGERRGNTDRTALQLQLRRTGMDQGAYNLRVIPEYVRQASRILGIEVRESYPGIGDESRAVISGVHASAVLKAKKIQEDNAGGVYLPVNYQELLGVEPSHVVRIGPMAGRASVHLWAIFQGLDEISDAQATKVIAWAKKEKRALTDDEIRKLLSV